MRKTKTQVTISDDLQLIIQYLQQKYPIFDINQSVEYLIARGSGDYLAEIGLSLQDLKDIMISKNQIQNGQSTKAKSMQEAILKLKS